MSARKFARFDWLVPGLAPMVLVSLVVTAGGAAASVVQLDPDTRRAQLGFPQDVIVNSLGDLLTADWSCRQIRHVTGEIVGGRAFPRDARQR